MAEKKTKEELLASLKDCPILWSEWRHYKTGGVYFVIGNAILESSQEPMVIYRQQSGVNFCRPLREWQEIVESDAGLVPRFVPA